MTRWAFVITFCQSIIRLCMHPCMCKQFLQTTSPPKPLIGFWPNFTGMILGWSSFKVVQIVPVHWLPRSQELKIDFLTENLKKSSCQKPLDRFQYNFAEMFLWWSSTKIFQAIVICQKPWPSGGGAYFPYISILKGNKKYTVWSFEYRLVMYFFH